MLLLLLTSKSWCHFMLIVNTTFPNNSPLQGVYSSIKPPISAHEIVLITLYRLVFGRFVSSNQRVLQSRPPPLTPFCVLAQRSRPRVFSLSTAWETIILIEVVAGESDTQTVKFPSSSSSFFNSVIQSCPTIMTVRSRIRIPPLFNLFHIN